MGNAVEGGGQAACQAGITVLGRFPAYINLAKDLGANFLNIPTEEFNALSPEDQWAANQAFLDRAVAAGDDFVLATAPELAREGSFYAQELAYLLSQGYVPNVAGTALVKGGP